MLTSTLLLPLVSLISTASARALFSSSAYDITSLTASTADDKTTFIFAVHDTEPVANVATSCNASWDGTDYPSQWIPCQNNRFAWELSAFVNISNFELQVKHSFVDPSVGDPPQNVATTFAKGTFTESNLTCTDSSCSLTGNETVKLPVWAATA